MEATYLLDRNSSINNNSLNLPADTVTKYNIFRVTPYTKTSASGKEEGMRVDVNLLAESKYIANLAASVKQQYNKEIHENL